MRDLLYEYSYRGLKFILTKLGILQSPHQRGNTVVTILTFTAVTLFGISFFMSGILAGVINLLGGFLLLICLFLMIIIFILDAVKRSEDLDYPSIDSDQTTINQFEQ